ncbi:coiled-coil domain-containing protein 39-like [Macrosteles quadrilineatus]|uniref:coiled-coil domain-containing protein 39-like n=1 Tax=Macrosteles quadrilineatus TaxID=74068 RepID=UPI0023E11499|nr:coiled-coil domain-containing protein 39-like [Macrosteles quadrilineatus]
MTKESEFNLKKFEQNIRNMCKQMQDSDEKQHLLQEEISRSMKKLEHLKSLVEWGEEARKSWQEELEAGDRDYNLLQRFKLEDDAKFKEMELKRQRLKADVNEREAILTNELNMMTTLENQLEQVSRLFRRAHKERMSLISYWENAVKILNQRDSSIDSTLQELQEIKTLAREKFAVLADERKFYEAQCENNEELGKQLDELNYSVVHQRNMNLQQTEITNNLKSEVTTLRGVITDLGTSLNKERSRNVQLTNEIQAREIHLSSLHSPIQELREKLRELEEADMTSAQRSREIHDILKSAEKNNRELQTKFDKIQEKVFEKTSELEAIRRTNEAVENEIKVLNLNTKAFEKRVNEIEKEIIDKEQVLYDMDMESMVLESKLSRLQGERTDEEKVRLKMRILELEEAVKKKKEVFNMVTAQYNRAKNEHIQLSAEVDEENEQSRKLTEKRQELVYLMEGGQKQLTALQQTNKQTQVTLNLLKLRVDQREKTLAKHENQVFGLEREKLELENALRERKVEIGLQMDLMAAKKRSLEEEKSELKKALEHLHIRIGQLQKKHDIVMDSLGKEDSGENFSVAHFKIKIAQERHELQEIGDDLDSKIKKAENEIPAMENTLRVISAANDCYKRNLDAIDSDSPEMQEKKKLEEQYYEARENLKDRQAILKVFTNQIHEMELSLSDLGECEERVRGEWRDKDVAARALDKELEEQQDTLIHTSSDMMSTGDGVVPVRSRREMELSLSDLGECEERVRGEWRDKDVAAQALDKELDEQQDTLIHTSSDMMPTGVGVVPEMELSLSDLGECEERVRGEWRDKDVAARALDKELDEQQDTLIHTSSDMMPTGVGVVPVRSRRVSWSCPCQISERVRGEWRDKDVAAQALDKELDEQQDTLIHTSSDMMPTGVGVVPELELSLSDLGECEERVRGEWRDKDVAARALDKELEEQQAKLLRADKLLKKLKREARQPKESRVPIHLAEKDIELRELQDINQSGLQQLAELATRYSEVAPLLNRYLGEKGLTLPLVRSHRAKISTTGSTLSTHRSLFSEDSRISIGSGPSSQTPSIIMLDPDTIQPGPRSSADSRMSKLSGSNKKSK